MVIVLTGGGSGGHITPILAVATELRRLQPEARLVYIGQRGDSLADIPAMHPAIDAVYSVRAGKFRRYSNMTRLQKLADVSTMLLNLRDLFYVAVGLVQSWWLMGRLRPAVVFTRGGYVSVPVALGAHLHGIPFITHDSDSTPSLANRIIARWAALHAVALPADVYPYPPQKTITVGVPVADSFQPVDSFALMAARQFLQLDYAEVIVLTGGGNGAEQLNRAMVTAATELLADRPGLCIVHIAGRALESGVTEAYQASLPAEQLARVRVLGFTTDLAAYSAAADIIVARGGATNLAEFAIQRKACVIIPAKFLPWQAHHTQVLADRGAVVNLTEAESEEPGRLAGLLAGLLNDAPRRNALAKSLGSFARPTASHDLAMLLLEQTTKQSYADPSPKTS